MEDPTRLSAWQLPAGVTARFIDTSPVGLKFHVLESLPAGFDGRECPPMILLLHGFPNLSYDWRFIMPKLSEAGYYAVAVDMRGFGRTHNADLSPLSPETFRPMVAVRDVLTLTHALGYDAIHTLVGHDLGAFVAATVATVRPDKIKSLVLMGHPWKGAPRLPFATHPAEPLGSVILARKVYDWERSRDPDIQSSLAELDPARKHYKWYNASETASDEWTYPSGKPLRDFLAGYFHVKSAAYVDNQPRRLKGWTAEGLAVMPHYYIMRADLSMRGNVDLMIAAERETGGQSSLGEKPWLTYADLDVYAEAYSRTTFANPLLWYRVLTDPVLFADLLCFADMKIAVPTKYVTGVSDWATFQDPGALEAMEQGVSVLSECWKGVVNIPGAGHWVNMEKPNETAREVIAVARSL